MTLLLLIILDNFLCLKHIFSNAFPGKMLLEIGQLVYSDLEPFGLDLGYTLTDDVAT